MNLEHAKSTKNHYRALMTKDLFQKMAFIRGIIFIKTQRKKKSSHEKEEILTDKKDFHERFSKKRRDSHGLKRFKRVLVKKKKFSQIKNVLMQKISSQTATNKSIGM